MGEKALRLKLELKDHHHKMMMDRRDKEIKRLKWANDELREENYKIKFERDHLKQYNRTGEWDWQQWAYSIERKNEALQEELKKEKKRIASIDDLKIWNDHKSQYQGKLNSISFALSKIEDYQQHYNMLVSALNMILRVKHDLHILRDDQIDNPLKEGLKLVKMLRRYSKAKSEIFDLVKSINDDFHAIKTIDSNAEWCYRKFFPDKEPVSFFDVFNKLFESHQDLKERLKFINDWCTSCFWDCGKSKINTGKLIDLVRSVSNLKNQDATKQWVDIYE